MFFRNGLGTHGSRLSSFWIFFGRKKLSILLSIPTLEIKLDTKLSYDKTFIHFYVHSTSLVKHFSLSLVSIHRSCTKLKKTLPLYRNWRLQIHSKNYLSWTCPFTSVRKKNLIFLSRFVNASQYNRANQPLKNNWWVVKKKFLTKGMEIITWDVYFNWTDTFSRWLETRLKKQWIFSFFRALS